VAFAERWPFLAFFLVIVLSNGVGSLFNILYNLALIVNLYLNEHQKQAFTWLLYAYNATAYLYCIGVVVYLLRPLACCRGALRAGRPVAPAELERCRLLLVNLPTYAVCFDLVGWLPGMVFFPLGICLLGGWEHAWAIWVQFAVSFFVSALLTATQTFFFLEAFLIRFFYPEFFFEGSRPADVRGAFYISFRRRLWIYWWAVAFVPQAALLAVAVNFAFVPLDRFEPLRLVAVGVAVGVAVVASLSTAVIHSFVGSMLVRWVGAHAEATEQIALENYEVRIPEQRPDEWGKLTDRFNDMAAALGRLKHARETLGQVVDPEVRDELLERFPGLEGEIEEITVLFTDIRGFTQRSAGEAPDRAVRLLNRFLSLAVVAVKDHGGVVDKFLGDGVMALFGISRSRADHADQAVRAGRELLARLAVLNHELATEGQAPLAIGIGIHTGPALVGCIGATTTDAYGRKLVRREFTAIGETVNLCQRVEQLTKTCGGPILLSEQTRAYLRQPVPLIERGCQSVPGYDGTVHVYQVDLVAEQGTFATGKSF
jgi:adenylate cyclase